MEKSQEASQFTTTAFKLKLKATFITDYVLCFKYIVKKRASMSSSSKQCQGSKSTKMVLPPLYGDSAPEKPTEKSKKGDSILGKEGDRQGHVVYQGFNEQIFAILAALSIKLPENKRLYKNLERIIISTIDKDITSPMTVWLETTSGEISEIIDGKEKKISYASILRNYTPDNVKRFTNIAPNIPLLHSLEISKNWQRFKPSDRKSLWKHFSSLFILSDTATSIPPDLMSMIQNMTIDLNNQGLIDLNKPLDQIGDVVEKAISGNAALQAMKEKYESLNAARLIPEPPTVAKRRQQAEFDNN